MSAEYRLEPCRSALNAVRGMPFDWSLNPYMGCAHRCTFCYVRAFERRADRPSDDRYGRSIRVKTNVAEVLARELSRPSWKRELVVIGAATDPYQPCEGRFRLTRRCLEVLAMRANPLGIITRGPLVVRDIDVLREASRHAQVRVNISVPTLDHELWQATEPGTAPPRQRLRAVRMLADAGVRVCVALAPILPGLTDRSDRLVETVRAAQDAGASSLWSTLLYLRPGTREHFLTTLARVWPEEAARLDRMYAGRAYQPTERQRALGALLAHIRERHPRRADVPAPIEPTEPPLFAQQLGLGLD